MKVPASEPKICMAFTVKVVHVTIGNPQELKVELLKRTKDAAVYATH